MSRLPTYLGFSIVLAAGTVFYVHNEHEQFYPTVVHLTTNKFCVAVLGNFGFSIALLIAYIIQRLFFGKITADEGRELIEGAKFSIPETCIALTMFREDFNVVVLCLFTGLLFVKGFHQLAEMRVEGIARQMTAPIRQLIGVFASLLFLFVVDCIIVAFLSFIIYKSRKFDVLAQFTFDFCVLLVMMMAQISTFIVLSIDAYYEGRWSYKPVIMFIIEFPIDLINLSIHGIYFYFSLINFGVPIHLVRGLLLAMNKVRMRAVTFYKYQQIVRTLDTQYQTVSRADLEAIDREPICIICMSDIEHDGKLLPCSHAFHLACLKHWFQQKQECPTCRYKIVPDATAHQNQNGRRVAPLNALVAARLRRRRANTENAENESQNSAPSETHPQPNQTPSQSIDRPSSNQRESSASVNATVESNVPWAMDVPPTRPLFNPIMFMPPNPSDSSAMERLQASTLFIQQQLEYHQMCTRHYEAMFRDHVLMQKRFMEEHDKLENDLEQRQTPSQEHPSDVVKDEEKVDEVEVPSLEPQSDVARARLAKFERLLSGTSLSSEDGVPNPPDKETQDE